MTVLVHITQNLADDDFSVSDRRGSFWDTIHYAPSEIGDIRHTSTRVDLGETGLGGVRALIGEGFAWSPLMLNFPLPLEGGGISRYVELNTVTGALRGEVRLAEGYLLDVTSYRDALEEGGVMGATRDLAMRFTAAGLTEGRERDPDRGVTFSGGLQGDRITGSRLDDGLSGHWGEDRIWGGDGDDGLSGGVRAGTAWGDIPYAAAGSQDDDTLYGGAGDDWLWAGAGRDLLYGGTGDDRVAIDPGSQAQAYGGSGNDVLDYPGLDARMDAGAGQDWILVGRDVDLSRGVMGPSGTGAIRNFEHVLDGLGRITGSDAANVLTASQQIAANTLRGLGGDDWLNGHRGNDLIDGGWGNDTLVGNDGRDTLTGGGAPTASGFWTTTPPVRPI